jgi:hypothetical protein
MAETPALIDARQTLERARQAFAQAEAEHVEQRRASLLTDLALIRAQLEEARARHKKLQARIHIDRDNYDNAQTKVRRRFEAVADSLRARPSIVDFLPDDPEAVQWTKRHAQLERQRDKAMEERNALPDPNDTAAECNRYLGPAGIIMELLLTEQNLMRAIEGKPGIVRMEGGVYPVS